MDVVVSGWRNWRHRGAVAVPLGRLSVKHPDLRLHEGCHVSGADKFACAWGSEFMPQDRHIHHPAKWSEGRVAGPRRNNGMIEVIAAASERLLLAYHEQLDPARGGTSDTVIRALLREIPVWHVYGEDPYVDGQWLRPDWLQKVPSRRLGIIKDSMINWRKDALG